MLPDHVEKNLILKVFLGFGPCKKGVIIHYMSKTNYANSFKWDYNLTSVLLNCEIMMPN